MVLISCSLNMCPSSEEECKNGIESGHGLHTNTHTYLLTRIIDSNIYLCQGPEARLGGWELRLRMCKKVKGLRRRQL